MSSHLTVSSLRHVGQLRGCFGSTLYLGYEVCKIKCVTRVALKSIRQLLGVVSKKCSRLMETESLGY